MRVLLVKLSSMGDVIHALPAISDAARMIPGVQFDWAVEEAFSEIPSWHPAVNRVITTPLRRWKKQPWKSFKSAELREWKKQLRLQAYDAVIDAQGLLKSAWVARLAKSSVRHGFARDSARESVAAYFYQQKYSIPNVEHAIDRLRQLMAYALHYDLPQSEPNYSIELPSMDALPVDVSSDYVVCVHATTWPSKHWPKQYWKDLIRKLENAGKQVYLPWVNDKERQRAEYLATDYSTVSVLPTLNLTALAHVLANASAVVAVDTGLGHLAAALGAPVVSLYGPTDPKFIGAIGPQSVYCCSTHLHCECALQSVTKKKPTPKTLSCMQDVSVDDVFVKLQPLL